MPVEIPAKVVKEEGLAGARYPAEMLASAPEMSPNGVLDEPLATLPKNTTAFPGFAVISTRSTLTVWVHSAVIPVAAEGVGNGEPGASEMPVTIQVLAAAL